MQDGTEIKPYLPSAETTDTADVSATASTNSIQDELVPGLRQFTSQFSEEEDRVVLNVGGVRHETHLATLRNIPDTRLANLAELHMAGEQKPIYFFERHPAVFNSVIDFYRTGELHVPLEVCGAVVKRELDYWQINENNIKSCCWRNYRSYIENKRILDSFNRSILKEQMHVSITELKGWRRFQTKIWLLLEHPRTSRMAMTYGVISLMFVVTSILGFCLETLPDLRPKNVTLQQTSVMTSCDGKNSTYTMEPNAALNILDTICTAFFTGELVVRFCFSPNKFKFVRSAMNIIDLLALVPLYMQLILNSDDLKFCYVNERLIFEIMFILRIIRMFRIFHLVKHYQALKILVYALKASVQELMMLGIFLLIGMLVFATMIYYAERKDAVNPSDVFNTIPIGFWWALITMTTVGYGDITPKTPIGYVVGTACAVSGVLLVALTIPVISNNFTLFYTHVRSRRGKQDDGEEDTDTEDGAKVYENARRTSNGSIILNERSFTITRKPSNLSAVTQAITTSNIAYNGDVRYGRMMSAPNQRYSDANSIMNVVVQSNESDYYNMPRSRSTKARSDDGVMYSGTKESSEIS